MHHHKKGSLSLLRLRAKPSPQQLYSQEVMMGCIPLVLFVFEDLHLLLMRLRDSSELSYPLIDALQRGIPRRRHEVGSTARRQNITAWERGQGG